MPLRVFGVVRGVEDHLWRGFDEPLHRGPGIGLREDGGRVLAARSPKHRVDEATPPDHVERIPLDHEHGAHPRPAGGLLLDLTPGAANAPHALAGFGATTHLSTQRLE